MGNCNVDENPKLIESIKIKELKRNNTILIAEELEEKYKDMPEWPGKENI